MNLELLTIVIPTRNRPEMLEKCLRSVYEGQTRVPKVIVSDNSTYDDSMIEPLRRKYGFLYVRQTGHLTMIEHWNKCVLGLPATRWVLMLHDDDELYPDVIGKLETFLAGHKDVGIVVGGIQFINQRGEAQREWVPQANGTLREEEALLRLGLDWGVRPPGMIFNVAASRALGGFPEIEGLPGDYSFALELAYKHGVAFYQELVGRYRHSTDQFTNYATPEKTIAHLDYSRKQGEFVRTFGCSAVAADMIVDYITWWPFLTLAPRLLKSHPSFLFELAQKFLRHSPPGGEWQLRAKRQYSFLFWRPQWLAWAFFVQRRRLRNILKKQKRLV